MIMSEVERGMSVNATPSYRRGMHIALVETRWQGHHPTYFREYIEALCELGCQVHAFCPVPEDPILAHLKERKFQQSVTLQEWHPPSLNFRPRRFAPRLNWLLAFRWLTTQLRKLEAQSKKPVDLVFFACLYDTELIFYPRNFGWKWAGLYIHVRSFRKPGSLSPYSEISPDPGRWLSRPQVRGIALLDEEAVVYVKSITGCENVVVFPDFTDETPPTKSGVGAQLCTFARGRPIVGMAGYLQPTKGVAVLARVAEAMQHDNVVFAFVGELMAGLFNEQEQTLLKRVFSLPNVFAYLKQVPDGGSFNGVVSCFDIFFTAYLDFPSSSNSLTKACLFRRPSIVSEGYLLSERVRLFRLGEVVPEGDWLAAVDAIKAILKAPHSHQVNARFAEYCEKHSPKQLRRAFIELLSGLGHARRNVQ